jgi:hypothetical protein
MSVQPESPPAWTQEKISDKQRDMILDLLEKKDISRTPQDQVDLLFKCLRISEDDEEYGMSKGQASRIITWLLSRNDKPGQPPEDPEMQTEPVGDGYYALRMDGHKNDLTFYRLNTGKHGRWQGYQFIDMVVGHGKRYPQKGGAVRQAIYDAIREQGITEAQKLYGQEIGRCGRCGRELTDETSRRFGIGPDCRDIMGL